jgi:hypothetical protein
MTVEQARRAVEVGIEVATSLAPGSGSLITGDMGIANKTASAPPPARRSCSTAIAGSAALVAAALCPPALEYALAHLGLRPLLGLDLLSSFRRHLRTTTNAPRTPRGRSSCTAASASKSSD